MRQCLELKGTLKSWTCRGADVARFFNVTDTGAAAEEFQGFRAKSTREGVDAFPLRANFRVILFHRLEEVVDYFAHRNAALEPDEVGSGFPSDEFLDLEWLRVGGGRFGGGLRMSKHLD